jgi:hypothetical protein
MRQRRGRRERTARPSEPNQQAAQPGSGNPAQSAAGPEPSAMPDLPVSPTPPGLAETVVGPAYGQPQAGFPAQPPSSAPAQDSTLRDVWTPRHSDAPWPRQDAGPDGSWERYDQQRPDGTWQGYGAQQPGDAWQGYGQQQPDSPWPRHGSPTPSVPPEGPPYGHGARQHEGWQEGYGSPPSDRWQPGYDQRQPFEPHPPYDQRQPLEARQPFEPHQPVEPRQPFGPQPADHGPSFAGPQADYSRHDRGSAPQQPPGIRQPFEPPLRYDPLSPPGPPPTYGQRQPQDQQWFFDTMRQAPGQTPVGQPAQQLPLAQIPPGIAQPATIQPPPPGRRRRRVFAIVAVVVVLVLGVGAAGAGYLLLRTHGSPSQTATSYLSAWVRGDYPAMDRVSVNVPHSGLASPLRTAAAQLGVDRMSATLGQVSTSGNSAKARFTVTDDLASGHVWTYQGQLSLLVKNRHWMVNWSPSAIYPGLRAGERFVQSASWPSRAQILAADGTVLSSPAADAVSGSIALLVGYVGPATAAEAKALGAPYRAGDQVGLSGIEYTYQKQLAGLPSLTIKLVGPGRQADATVARFAAKAGTPVHTSLDMSVQYAASQAVSGAKTKKPVDLVAMQASTGKVLAVVERPGGYDRALQGIFPPGSTFKVVTASALARTGLTPTSPVECPSQVNIGGRVFHNDKYEHYGSTDLLTAFAASCNTTFALQATERLTGATLGSMARVFGFNARPDLGLPAILGSYQTPHDPVDLAADAFGQGTDLVNPLSQAAEVAAIDSGTWRPPLLVIDPAPRQYVKPHPLSPAIVDTLRPMMRAVVTIGTAAGVGLPSGTYGKTGTAEYMNGSRTDSHGWFIGYRGDVAFAVLVEGGGYGADSAGPIANAFLRKL